MSALTMEAQTGGHQPPSTGIGFPEDRMPYVLSDDVDRSQSPDEDEMGSGSPSLENCTLTTQSLTSVECQPLDSYSVSSGSKHVSQNLVNHSESLQSVATNETEANDNSQSPGLEQLEPTLQTVEQPMLHPMPMMYSAAQIPANLPNQPMILLQQPPNAAPVVHCGGIQLTQQDLLQIQQQLQQKLLSQPVTTAAPVQVNIPPQQYVILGSLNPNAQQFIVPAPPNQAFPQVAATPAMIPVLQPMTSLSTTTQSQSEVTTQPLPTVTSTGETNPTKPTSKLTKAPPKTSMQYPLPEEMVELEELERFAKHFKLRRVELGFTQGDVGTAIGKSFPTDFSQTTISRFEALNLSYKNMCKIKPYLQRWLDDHENRVLVSNTFAGRMSPEPLPPGCKRRKKRTTIEDHMRDLLEISFQMNPKPNTDDLTRIANQHNLDRDVVRVWFCNRRQREKRLQLITATQRQLIEASRYPVIVTIPDQTVESHTDNIGKVSEGATAEVVELTPQQEAENEQAHAALGAAMMSQQGASLRGYAQSLVFHNG